VHFRWAGPQDAELVHKFICALAEYEHSPTPVLANVPVLRALLSRNPPAFWAIFAEIDEKPRSDAAPTRKPVGYALFYENFSTWRGKCGMFMEDLFVLREYRGKGLGALLLKKLAQVCVERNYARLDWQVAVENDGAQQFYKALGAKSLNQWIYMRLEDDAVKSVANRPIPGVVQVGKNAPVKASL